MFMHLLSKVLVVLRKKKFFHFTYPLSQLWFWRSDFTVARFLQSAVSRIYSSLETTPLPQHRMYCITSTWKGLVDMPYRFRISPQESWGTYFVCTSYGMRLNCHSLAINKTLPSKRCAQFIHTFQRYKNSMACQPDPSACW